MSGSRQSLSATNLATYHHFNCDLYLHNVYHKSEASEAPSIAQVQSKELSRAQLRRGIDWEVQLLSWLDEENMLLTVPTFPMTGEDLVENLLLDDREHVFVAGFSFWPPQERLNALYQDCGQRPVALGLAKPDFLEITRTRNGVSWRVVDAKASASVKTSHHVQIYFYTLCLQYLLPKPFFQASPTAAVWLPPTEGFNTTPPSLEDLKPIKVSLLSQPLDRFLFRRLPLILNLPQDSVSWHFNPNCNGCPYTSSCSRRSIEDGKLGSMTNISFGQARVLRNLLSIWRNGEGEKVTDIEDLASLFGNGIAIKSLSKSSPITMRKAKRVLALPARVRDGSRPLKSAVVEAARTKTIQLIPRRNYNCPRSEDVTVILSLIPDPASPSIHIISFCISIFTTLPSIQVPKHIYGNGEILIPSLARTIRSILSSAPTPPCAQFYVFSSSENSALQTYLINAALDSNESSDDIRICIGTLAQGASLLQTTFQPLVLSGVLLDFLANKQKQKSELVACLERMNLPTNGTMEVLRQRIQDHLRKHQHQGEQRRKELGQLPRVVVLKTEIERCLALPIPGFWDLPGCTAALVSPSTEMKCPTDEELYTAFKGEFPLEPLLRDRNKTIFTVLCSFRKRLLGSRTDILVNTAKPLSVNFMDLCRDEKLRKLFYMQQFEVLAKLSELWKSRIEGCPDAPILEYRSVRQGGRGLEHLFLLKSGVLDMPNIDKGRSFSFFDYILTEDHEENEFGELPTEALFDDLGVSGLMFPLNKYTKSRWDLQHPNVKEKLLVADVRDMSLDGQHTQVVLQTWGSDNLTIKFVVGHFYRLSPRVVDFNTLKILTTLFELDLRSEAGEQVPFLKLVLDPNSFRRGTNLKSHEDFRKAGTKLQSMFRELEGLRVEGAGPLVLKTSQNQAAQHVLSNYLSVIWGPPGTGKTHTIALSLLRLLNIQYNLGERRRKIIFITAMTHAAIEAILDKLSFLTQCYRSINSLPTGWLNEIKVEHVLKGNDHPRRVESSGTVIYAGTVYQLYNLCKKQALQVDVLMIDEAGQLALSAASLVLRSLNSTGKVIIAGDQEQLSPILAAKYPLLKTGPLFGSILDCLVHFSRRIRQALSSRQGETMESLDDIFSSQGSVVQLTENFRLNPDLGEFISTIYSRPFIPQKVQARQLATALNKVARDMGRNFGLNDLIVENVQFFFLALSNVMVRQPQSFLSRPAISNPRSGGTNQPNMDPAFNPISLTLLRLEVEVGGQAQEVSYEVHIKAEAMLVAALVLQLQRCSPTDDIFVATPHRVQRQAVRSALESAKRSESDSDRLDETFERLNLESDNVPEFSGKVTVDTVERLQGSEAPFVICLFSLPSSEIVELKFLLERRRMNVAISRAKTLCILISSSQVLRPPVEILADNECAKGYAFLKAYEDRAWSATIKVNMDTL